MTLVKITVALIAMGFAIFLYFFNAEKYQVSLWITGIVLILCGLCLLGIGVGIIYNAKESSDYLRS